MFWWIVCRHKLWLRMLGVEICCTLSKALPVSVCAPSFHLSCAVHWEALRSLMHGESFTCITPWLYAIYNMLFCILQMAVISQIFSARHKWHTKQSGYTFSLDELLEGVWLRDNEMKKNRRILKFKIPLCPWKQLFIKSLNWRSIY